MKKIFSILLAAVVLLALCAPVLASNAGLFDDVVIIDDTASGAAGAPDETAASAPGFSDWNPDAWWAVPMQWCVDNGYFNGTDENRIEAERHITRAEYIAVIVRYAGLSGEGDISAFTDVSADDWFYNAVAVGYGNGVTTGITEELFVPNANITREQAFTMYTRALSMDSNADSALERFSDSGSVSGWARDSVNAIVACGVVSGYTDGTLLPLNPITRGEVAQILYKTGGSSTIDDETVPLAELPGVEIGEEEVPLAELPTNGGGGGRRSSGGGGTPVSYVYFETETGSGTVRGAISDGHVAQPEDPVRPGYTFGGWYTEDGVKFDFDYDDVYDGMILYARWLNEEQADMLKQLNSLAAQGTVYISLDTDLLATIGDPEVPCAISYSGANANSATLRLVDESGSDLIAPIAMAPGYTADTVTLAEAPAGPPSDSAVKFIVTPDGGASAEFEATLWVAYLWNLG